MQIYPMNFPKVNDDILFPQIPFNWIKKNDFLDFICSGSIDAKAIVSEWIAEVSASTSKDTAAARANQEKTVAGSKNTSE